jgi:hypothetical protein
MNFNFNSRLLCNCPLNHIISEISPTIDGEKAWILFRHLHNTSYQTHQIMGGLYHENGALLSVSRQRVQYVVFRSNGEEVRYAKQPIWFDKEAIKGTSLPVLIHVHDLLFVTVSKGDKIIALLTKNRVGTVTNTGELENTVTLKPIVYSRMWKFSVLLRHIQSLRYVLHDKL